MAHRNISELSVLMNSSITTVLIVPRVRAPNLRSTSAFVRLIVISILCMTHCNLQHTNIAEIELESSV